MRKPRPKSPRPTAADFGRGPTPIPGQAGKTPDLHRVHGHPPGVYRATPSEAPFGTWVQGDAEPRLDLSCAAGGLRPRCFRGTRGEQTERLDTTPCGVTRRGLPSAGGEVFRLPPSPITTRRGLEPSARHHPTRSHPRPQDWRNAPPVGRIRASVRPTGAGRVAHRDCQAGGRKPPAFSFQRESDAQTSAKRTGSRFRGRCRRGPHSRAQRPRARCWKPEACTRSIGLEFEYTQGGARL